MQLAHQADLPATGDQPAVRRDAAPDVAAFPFDVGQPQPGDQRFGDTLDVEEAQRAHRAQPRSRLPRPDHHRGQPARLGGQNFVGLWNEDAADLEDRDSVGEAQVVARRVQQARQQRPAQVAAVRSERVDAR